MSGLEYETVARFAQQGGTVYFAVLFVAGLVYALWPRNQEDFKRLAQLPLEDDESDHAGT
ncbi:MAG: cbb3-type cytochrome c oxidase subunit 3 [Phenylobacterium sp.]